MCVKFYSPSKGNFLLGEGRICPSGFRRCGKTLSEFLCVKQSLNCPINDFFLTNDPDIIPDKVSKNPEIFYYVFDLRNGGGRIFYSRDNPNGNLLTEDFEFAYSKICMDKTEKTVEESLASEVFNNYKHVSFHSECQDPVNNYLQNNQYIKSSI